MSDIDFQREVLQRLTAIESRLESGGGKISDHETRLRDIESKAAEMKGRVAIIAAVLSVVFSLVCVWLGKHL